MTGYLINFAVYTMAMVGALLLCFVVYKKTVMGNKYSKNPQDNLEIENSLSISPKKTLYVVKAGDEKFLIASDPECTTFLAKLNTNCEQTAPQTYQEPLNCTIDVEPVNIAKPREAKKYAIDYNEILNNGTNKKQPMMRGIIKKLNIPE